MLVVNALHRGALMLCWARLCVALSVSHGQQLIPDHDLTMTGDHHTMSSTEASDRKNEEHAIPLTRASSAPRRAPHNTPCFVDDVLTALREGTGSDADLTDDILTLFGVCAASDNSSGSALLELAGTSRNQRGGLEVLPPTGGLVVEEDDTGNLGLTFDLPPSPLLTQGPALLLALERPLRGSDLDVTFTSQSLQPNTQSACVSEKTQYILLSGKASDGNGPQTWRISAETQHPHMKQSLKDILTGGKSGSNISIILLLLFPRGTGTETRLAPDSSQASSQTFSFLCELKRFLGDVLPQDRPASTPLQLDSLQSLPPLSLGLSSSETLLSGLINSSSPTVFSFSSWGSVLQVHHGQLAMSPELLEELRQRLEQLVMQITEVMREEGVGHRAAERLGRLTGLSALLKKKPATGESQYRAFLLLRALHAVAHAYTMKRGLRETRAGPDSLARTNVCGLKSLTVSLEKHLVGPNTANINNCCGSCTFPLFNTNNHAVLLNSHIVSEGVDERAPCCVPVAYDPLEVVDVNEHGTYLSIKPDVIAKECGCR